MDRGAVGIITSISTQQLQVSAYNAFDCGVSARFNTASVPNCLLRRKSPCSA
jgi:hypothetical protein